MKKFSKNLTITVSVVFFAFVALGFIFAWPTAVHAATAPTLGSLSAFGVVSNIFTNGNTPPQTIINGSVCYTTGPAADPLTVTGTYGVGCPVSALADQNAALGILNGQVCTPIAGMLNAVTIGANSPGTFPPGCYSVTGAMDITSGTTVTLDATAPGGDGGNVWVFKSSGALTTGASTAGFPSIVLANGASANNVFWVPVGDTTIGANFAPSATPTFVGNIFRGTAAGLSITLGHFTNLLGRTLAFGSTVTTDANTITVPTTLTLNKVVINNNGGSAVATAWTLSTVALSPTLISGTTGSTDVTNATVAPGAYTLSESGGPAGYTASLYSCVKNGGAAVVGNSITLAAGDDATCTITNNDIASQLTVTKVVINDNNGTKAISDFPLFINGMSVISGIASTTLPGSYTVSETTDSGYTSTITGDCAANGTITLALGDVKICTITNDDIAPPPSGGSVFIPSVPPLIDVVKVPSPLALPVGPGSVTYTYTLRNIGTVPVTYITMVDDSCSPTTLVSGDINANAKLELNETWTYRCSTTLSKTHTNTVVATGWANGISATDIAIATVVVGVPVVPPLIHITKIPSPIALSAGGGMVTYTKRVTNPGTVALSNVRVTDDKCSPIKYISGDMNNDSKLDITEAWIYTCQSRLIKTTTNTAVVTGEANDLTARDFAIATVVVASAVSTTIVPKLPNTGIAPMENLALWPIAMAGILAILFLLYVIRKKQTI